MDKKLVNYLISFLYILIFIVPSLWSYGFDSATSCSQKSSRHGRAQLLASIPCDLTQQAYCNLPGSQYPWHAVRRFVHENQGLMKRMYGDIRHISILRSEIRNNDIDIEDFENTAARYSRDNFHNRKMKYLQTSESFQNSKNDVVNEPHFRPTTSTPTISTAAITTTTTTIKSTTPISPSASSSSTSSLSPVLETTEPQIAINRDSSLTQNDQSDFKKTDSSSKNFDNKQKLDQIEFIDSPDNNLELTKFNVNSNANSNENLQQIHEMDNIKVVQSPNLSSIPNKTAESVTISTTLKVVQQIIQSEIESEKATEKQQHQQQHNKKNTDETAEIIQRNSQNSQNLIDNVIEQNTEKSQNLYKNQTQFNEILKDNSNSIQVLDNDGNNKQQQQQQHQHQHQHQQQQQQQHEAFIEKKKTNKPSTIIETSQLFQDTIQKETPAIINLKGVNACPVKEEVVAPFWANNTRGEVLALLNLYPFEQYVHWEKCTHENKQMYCRDGCRCEQQYRLHRLLAYDPHNECRGIFSDWFRFPSCCICKCYDIPLEFRATSRSPRTSLNNKNYYNDDNDTNDDDDDDNNEDDNSKDRIKKLQHPIDIAEHELKRAMYEHATEDWYRPRDDFDYLYD